MAETPVASGYMVGPKGAGTRFAEDGGELAAGPTANDGSTPPKNEADDPARAIAEADIVKVVGNTLYALPPIRV
jgi:hypothetical protein